MLFFLILLPDFLILIEEHHLRARCLFAERTKRHANGEQRIYIPFIFISKFPPFRLIKIIHLLIHLRQNHLFSKSLKPGIQIEQILKLFKKDLNLLNNFDFEDFDPSALEHSFPNTGVNAAHPPIRYRFGKRFFPCPIGSEKGNSVSLVKRGTG